MFFAGIESEGDIVVGIRAVQGFDVHGDNLIDIHGEWDVNKDFPGVREFCIRDEGSRGSPGATGLCGCGI